MRKNVWLSIPFALAAWLPSAFADGPAPRVPPTTPGSKCAVSAECPGDLVCIQYKCQLPPSAVPAPSASASVPVPAPSAAPSAAPPPLPPPGAVAECVAPFDCTDGATCEAGHCVKPKAAAPKPAQRACTEDGQCGSGHACILGQCRKAAFQQKEPKEGDDAAEGDEGVKPARRPGGGGSSDQANNAIFAEIFGVAVLGATLNYERRFGSYFVWRGGLGGSLGEKYYYTSGRYASSGYDPRAAFVLTTGASFLIGSDDHKFEAGVSLTAMVPGGLNANPVSINPLYVGYRYQPVDGGFVFRIGATVFAGVGHETLVLPWGGISFGYAF